MFPIYSGERLTRVEGPSLVNACARATAAAVYLSTRTRAQHFDPGIMECYVDNPADPQSGVFVEHYSSMVTPWSTTDMLLPLRAWLNSGHAGDDFEISCVALSEKQDVVALLRGRGYQVTSMPHDEMRKQRIYTVDYTQWLHEFEISRLRPDEADQVNSVWPYGSKNSLELIRYLIMHRPNLALRRRDNQSCIGWLLVQSDYSMGMAHVWPEYRGLGILTRLHNMLDYEHEKSGFEIFGYIRNDNAAMMRSAQKAGMIVLQKSVWFHAFQPSNTLSCLTRGA